MNAVPTPNEVELAAVRAKVAADEQEAIAEVVEACGPGAEAYAYWVITDRKGELPDKMIPCCRRVGTGWLPPTPNPSERFIDHPQSFTDAQGVRHHPFRFTVSIWTFSGYRPQTAEQLAAARVRRETKAAEEARRRGVQQELQLT